MNLFKKYAKRIIVGFALLIIAILFVWSMQNMAKDDPIIWQHGQAAELR